MLMDTAEACVLINRLSTECGAQVQIQYFDDVTVLYRSGIVSSAAVLTTAEDREYIGMDVMFDGDAIEHYLGHIAGVHRQYVEDNA